MPHTNETWQQILQQKTPQILQTTPPAADAADAAAPASDAIPLPAHFAVLIDHTLLKPSATPHQIDSLCDEAITHRFTSVCVNGIYALRASRRLANTPVKTCVVIGFPLGAVASEVKALYPPPPFFFFFSNLLSPPSFLSLTSSFLFLFFSPLV
jgi:deoxyribose-phosphate aldolase